MPECFSTVLLAGGRSERMRADKAFLDWHGQPLWRLQTRKLLALRPRQTFIAARREQNFRAHVQDAAELAGSGIICADDPHNECRGPIGAIARCLRAAGGPLLVLAVDLPLMTSEFLRDHFVASAEKGRGLVFRGEHGHEALVALYVPEMLPLFDDALAAERHALQPLITAAAGRGWCEARPLPAGAEPLFTNINTAVEAERVLHFQSRGFVHTGHPKNASTAPRA